MNEVTLEIDGRKIKVEKGLTILEAAKGIGINIPTLCYHPLVAPFGACRLCSVEVEKQGKKNIVTSCVYPVEEGLVVNTKSPEVIKVRKMIIELLMARCPNVKIIQDLAQEYGIKETRFELEDETCVLCGLCTRICEERVGVSATNFIGRGVNRMIEGPLEDHLGTNLSDMCIGCGACAYVCPTGTIVLEDLYKKIRSSFPFGTVEERTFGRRSGEDEVLGIYKNCYAVRSKKEDILERAQDGGAVTSLLAYALESGMIDAAVITVADNSWEPTTKVATSYDDLKEGAGTKYTFYPSGIGISEAVNKGYEDIGFVGTPCQTEGLRKILTSDQPYSIGKEKIKLLVGLFCLDTFKQELMGFINDKITRLEEVGKLDVKGRDLNIYEKNGEMHAVPLSDIEGYVNKGCFACTDFSSELADISIGSVGSDMGWNTVITRTDRGVALLEGAINDGYVEAKELKDLKLLIRLAKIKRKRAKEETGTTRP
jgi:Coenzyme F420-reducing hydrogenase, beta subunit